MLLTQLFFHEVDNPNFRPCYHNNVPQQRVELNSDSTLIQNLRLIGRILKFVSLRFAFTRGNKKGR